MRILSFFLIVPIIVLAVSCKAGPQPVQNDNTETMFNIQNTEKPVIITETFDPTRITQAFYESTREEVQQFIERLNQIIRSRNYNAWRAALSPEHFAEISSPQNLREISELPAMKTRNIILRTPQDYFTHVVVPSRANSRVDDIEFISMNRVKAFTITTNRAGEEVRLRLYDLEKINNTWTIIN